MSWVNILLGAGIQVFEGISLNHSRSVSTLGQPFEVLKTHMAANRSDSLATALSKTYARGGMRGFWQGLIPWFVSS